MGTYTSNNNFDDKNKIDDAYRHYGNYGCVRGNITAQVDSIWLHNSTKGAKHGKSCPAPMCMTKNHKMLEMPQVVQAVLLSKFISSLVRGQQYCLLFQGKKRFDLEV